MLAEIAISAPNGAESKSPRVTFTRVCALREINPTGWGLRRSDDGYPTKPTLLRRMS